MLISGGFVNIKGFHPEQILSPIIVSIPTSLANGMVTLEQFTGGVNCTSLVTLTSTNTLANFTLRPPDAFDGCTRMVLNQQPSAVT
jgi:hypothetical protein